MMVPPLSGPCGPWRCGSGQLRARHHTRAAAPATAIAVGEVFNSVCDCRQLITEQLIDYIRTTVVHAGGITHLRRIFDLANLYQVRTGSHGATDLSPIT